MLAAQAHQIMVMRIALGRLFSLFDVQSGGGIDLGTHEAADNEESRDSDHQRAETTSDGAGVFHVLHGLVASELHMPGFFNHVDLANGADLVEYVLAAHPVPLHDVEDRSEEHTS